ncbi:MarR family transcriptional regulator [Sporosarcina sp. CAU 1771]
MSVEQQFFRSYIKLYRPIVNQLNTILLRYDLFNAQWTVLNILSREGEMTSVDIADRLMVEKPSIAKVVKKLHEIGYIEVSQGTDKREKLLSLSTEGQRITEAIRSELQPVYERILKGIATEDMEKAKLLLDAAYKNLMN